MAGKFELKKSGNNQFYFSLLAVNGEPLLASETYSSKAGAENGIRAVQANALINERYERRTASDGQPFFVLKAENSELIARSETYSSESAMESGIKSVKYNAPTAETNDLT